MLIHMYMYVACLVDRWSALPVDAAVRGPGYAGPTRSPVDLQRIRGNRQHSKQGAREVGGDFPGMGQIIVIIIIIIIFIIIIMKYLYSANLIYFNIG